MKTALQMRNGVPVLTIDGKPVAPMMTYGGPDGLQETAKLMRAHGFRMYTHGLPLPWPHEGQAYDFSDVDATMAALLRNDPQALYMPRIGVEPPDWWKQEHPEEMPLWENGRSDQFISVTSRRWLEEAPRHIDKLVRYLEAHWDKHIFAYHPCALNSGEWYYASTIWQCNDWGLRNYDLSFVQGFRSWLRKRYSDIERVNEAWGTDHRDFERIEAPTPDVRRQTAHGLLRNPVSERAVIDFTVYQSVAITDAIRAIAQAFKQACDWRKLVYIFYGYTIELCGLQEGISQFGQLDFDAVMDDPAIDVWCAPSGYFDRRNGGSGPIMALTESVNAHGRVWCNEDDLRTHLSKPQEGGWGRVETLDETIWAHRRNFMAALVRRSQMWFMDQQHGGWFEDDAIWQNLEVLRRLYEQLYTQPSPLCSDVAVVVDEMSLCQIAYGIEIGLPLLYDMRGKINRMGATPELWLQADYLRGKVTGKKLVIFLNAFSLSAEDRAIIRRQLSQDGATALWFYAPGLQRPNAETPDQAYDVSGIEEVTGIEVIERKGKFSPGMRPMVGHRFTSGVANDAVIAPDDIISNWPNRDEKFQFRQMTYPPRDKLSPLFAVADSAAEIFGHYVDSDDPAMAVKDVNGLRSVFVGGLTLPARILANIAADAGVHLYCPAGDVIYTDGRFLSLTACTPGEKTITLPGPALVTDVHTRQEMTRGRDFSLTLRLGETRVYRVEYADRKL